MDRTRLMKRVVLECVPRLVSTPIDRFFENLGDTQLLSVLRGETMNRTAATMRLGDSVPAVVYFHATIQLSIPLVTEGRYRTVS